MHKRWNFISVIALLCGLIILTVAVALFSGSVSGCGATDPDILRIILFDIRLPRILLAFITGFTLAVCGVVLQACLQNPLAEPFVLGTSAGASTLVVAGMVLGVSGWVTIVALGIAGAIISLIIVVSLAGDSGGVKSYRLVIAGIIMHSFFSAILMMLITWSQSSSGIMYWLMGNLANKPLRVVLSVGLFVVAGFVFIHLLWKELNLLSLGDEQALSGGVDVKKYKSLLLAVSALMTGAVVAISGIIGFVGIIVPHVCRMLIGANHRHLLLVSALGGGFFLLLADTIMRLSLNGMEMPVGVVTALCGAPFFVWILKRKQ